MVFAPDLDLASVFLNGLSEGLRATLPFDLLMQLVSWLEPAWLWQKLIPFLLFFLAGVEAQNSLAISRHEALALPSCPEVNIPSSCAKLGNPTK